MTIFQRITKILLGLLMLMFAIVFLFYPGDEAYWFVILVLTVGLAIRGIKDIVFYFMMARHMVGGKMILFQGVVVLDFAILSITHT